MRGLLATGKVKWTCQSSNQATKQNAKEVCKEGESIIHCVLSFVNYQISIIAVVVASYPVFPSILSLCRLMGLVSNQSNNHAIQVEEEHQQMKSKLEERFLVV